MIATAQIQNRGLHGVELQTQNGHDIRTAVNRRDAHTHAFTHTNAHARWPDQQSLHAPPLRYNRA